MKSLSDLAIITMAMMVLSGCNKEQYRVPAGSGDPVLRPYGENWPERPLPQFVCPNCKSKFYGMLNGTTDLSFKAEGEYTPEALQCDHEWHRLAPKTNASADAVLTIVNDSAKPVIFSLYHIDDGEDPDNIAFSTDGGYFHGCPPLGYLGPGDSARLNAFEKYMPLDNNVLLLDTIANESTPHQSEYSRLDNVKTERVFSVRMTDANLKTFQMHNGTLRISILLGLKTD